MKANNWEHYEIVMSLQDPLDYKEYLAVCVKMSIIPKTVLAYGQKVGLLLLAGKLYPNLPLREAYDKIFEEHSEQEPEIIPKLISEKLETKEVSVNQTTPCGVCGGGRIR